MRSTDDYPSLGKIAEYWYEADRAYTVFPPRPYFRHCWDWGTPFCFRCGWLAPVPNYASRMEKGSNGGMGRRRTPKPEPVFRAAWSSAGGWLERAHLQDDCNGGSIAVSNLVPLCVLCHEEQPYCSTQEDGIAFVNSAPHWLPLGKCGEQVASYFQEATDTWYGPNEHGVWTKANGREGAWRKMMRAVSIAQSSVLMETSMRAGNEGDTYMREIEEHWGKHGSNLG